MCYGLGIGFFVQMSLLFGDQLSVDGDAVFEGFMLLNVLFDDFEQFALVGRLQKKLEEVAHEGCVGFKFFSEVTDFALLYFPNPVHGVAHYGKFVTDLLCERQGVGHALLVRSCLVDVEVEKDFR